ncbi:MAG: 4-hydroxy-tetrahydrodipicolinate reductase [Fusobacteria bacterium]|nr:4-hydroxy-tetrahydrodipicolinate reductase [Fusobacteriota bacterium]
MIKVGIIGGLGKMGQEAIKAISKDKNMQLSGIVDIFFVNETKNIDNIEYKVYGSIEELADKVDVFLDLTGPNTVFENAKKTIELGKNLIIGATGLSNENIEYLKKISDEKNVNVMIIPNFAIGAVLMMEFSKKAAEYLNEVEIIEYHHPAKLDAPSGTAIKTAQLIQEVKLDRGELVGTELIKGARGATLGDINIHSVRLNGFVASQEVIFGGLGQTLTIRHDSINRESFMPGIIMCIKKIGEIRGLIYGLENLL